jgi:hypothetical protein
MDSVRHVTHIEHVRRDYTYEEIRQKGTLIAKLLQDAERLEGEKKLAADSFKNQIEKVEEQISQLGKEIRLGYEEVPTPCDVVLNKPTPGMKSYVSQKTLEVVRTVPMTDQERQRSFFEDFRESSEYRPPSEEPDAPGSGA